MPDEEHMRLLGMLDAAIRVGEQRADEMLKLACEVQQLRREIRHAVKLLSVGKIEEARMLLQSLGREK